MDHKTVKFRSLLLASALLIGSCATDGRVPNKSTRPLDHLGRIFFLSSVKVENNLVRVEVVPVWKTNVLHHTDHDGKNVDTFVLNLGDNLTEQEEHGQFTLTLQSASPEKVKFVWNESWSFIDGNRGAITNRNVTVSPYP